MSIIRFFLPFLFRRPKVGDRYVHEDDSIDPFATPLVYEVKEIRKGWVLCAYGQFGGTRSIPLANLIAFYRQVSS